MGVKEKCYIKQNYNTMIQIIVSGQLRELNGQRTLDGPVVTWSNSIAVTGKGRKEEKKADANGHQS